METTSKYSEVKIDHIDENGVAHIDSFKTHDDDENGMVLGYIMNGEIYWKNERAINDPLVQSVVADYIVQYKEEREKQGRVAKTGEEAAEELSDFVNNFGCDYDGFVKELTTDKTHRTLQQSSIRLFLKCIEAHAEKPDRMTDDRNVSVRDVCKAIVAGFRKEKIQEFIKQGDSPERAEKNVGDFKPSQYLGYI